jgi:MerR family mercuric resistance operon transcriptional regulator
MSAPPGRALSPGDETCTAPYGAQGERPTPARAPLKNALDSVLRYRGYILFMSKFTIGKLAKSAAVGVETVRFYERKGLIKRPSKNGSGFRQYAADDSLRIRFIKRAQELGCTLREVKELLELNATRRTTCSDYSVRIERKLAEIDGKIKDLLRMKRALNEALATCGESPRDTECRILDCFEKGWKMPKTDKRKVGKT